MLELFRAVTFNKLANEIDVGTEWLLPNVKFECSTLLLRIREVSGSNLSPETGYPG
jgi:hypothetical protein